MENETRFGENEPRPFRSPRVFNANGAWYFTTREGNDHGPFSTRAMADTAVMDFLLEQSIHERPIRGELA